MRAAMIFLMVTTTLWQQSCEMEHEIIGNISCTFNNQSLSCSGYCDIHFNIPEGSAFDWNRTCDADYFLNYLRNQNLIKEVDINVTECHTGENMMNITASAFNCSSHNSCCQHSGDDSTDIDERVAITDLDSSSVSVNSESTTTGATTLSSIEEQASSTMSAGVPSSTFNNATTDLNSSSISVNSESATTDATTLSSGEVQASSTMSADIPSSTFNNATTGDVAQDTTLHGGERETVNATTTLKPREATVDPSPSMKDSFNHSTISTDSTVGTTETPIPSTLTTVSKVTIWNPTITTSLENSTNVTTQWKQPENNVPTTTTSLFLEMSPNPGLASRSEESEGSHAFSYTILALLFGIVICFIVFLVVHQFSRKSRIRYSVNQEMKEREKGGKYHTDEAVHESLIHV